MKKLLITSTDLMMVQFLIPHVKYLSEHGFQIELACSEVGGRLDEVRQAVEGYAQAVHQVRLYRSPVKPGNLKGYRDMKQLLQQNHYDIIWTNEPVMGVVTRLAARKHRKSGTKVIYMCHGFHFYKGASLANWALYYPVERFVSRFTDVLVTLNHEDETRAKTFRAKEVAYIHGIGLNTGRLKTTGQTDIRAELGLEKDAFLVLSVGELNENKNHKVILQAIADIGDENMHYLLCGKGDLRQSLEEKAKDLGVAQRVHFLGYRRDVVDICSQVDVFAHPSMREGLSVASLEAMYCGLPLVMSTVRGASDYLEDGKSGFLCRYDDVQRFAQGLKQLKEDGPLRKSCAQRNRSAVRPYILENVQQEIKELIKRL